MFKYNHIIFAGTFDRLHVGHKKLLDKAFELADKVSIGITTNEMIKNKLLSQIVEKLDIRYSILEKYLITKNFLKRAQFFVLKDIYGPSIEDNDFDSILVTELTKKNAARINKMRELRGIRDLRIITEPLVRGEDGEVVTSERIRMGEIDRYGHNPQFSILNFQKKELKLPKNLREELRKPLGEVISGSENELKETVYKVIKFIKFIKPTMVIAVGDIVTKSLVGAGYSPDVNIIDLRSRRKQIFNSQLSILNEFSKSKFQIKKADSGPHFAKASRGRQARMMSFLGAMSYEATPESISLVNDPGTINIKTANEIKKSINEFIKTGKKQLMIVKGEEDLLALPAILFAPLNSVVLYGQIDLGVVMVEVTEEKKKGVEEILKKFQ
ncbi:hypothetical protein A2767_02025 [Candidatus Roizmanbacteria bacterium RIFCSPHIGHO2_01_FULL_35_10]|uniref:Cytidyltransferase-like domain-containing protein n=1 Tax=Candidatus Roizmanbacteria bacterium RIFCSPLOWO2_01_FULL_35_13 TaxID=1802055 RepID=A0A1F7I789_9BACT|nr:MAG: hypothetical protein A2767_02025 [Candidatus Roizmanbacteria bacterium RIFCSPHIGHO2_01_FULL_35_10]OGK39238.1 MAG: hypothetical protein A3A74_07440 [Candidatus Roizmanbacteria bacterium RIFCSPLOWO2_01_FULL_35_13]